MIRNAARQILSAAILAGVVSMPMKDARAGSKYDGQWSVIIFTSTGTCDPSYRISGQIVNGEISYAYGSVVVMGHVLASGATVVRVTAGDRHGEAHGHMTASHGNGTWSGQGPDGHCAGTWIATRPGSAEN